MEAEPFHIARYLLRYKDKDRAEYTITPNETDEQRARNRRVEITIRPPSAVR